MENDFIPGNTPRGNRKTLHLLFLLLNSISHRRSLVLPQPLSKITLYRLVPLVHTSRFYVEDWSNLNAVTVGVCVCVCVRVYINKCVMRFHWHYPTQGDNNVTFLTTLCILLECHALCQDARACSNRLCFSSVLPLLTTNTIHWTYAQWQCWVGGWLLDIVLGKPL